MMDTNGRIVIQLVKVDGRLVGRTASDRWNLASLGYADGGLYYTRNGGNVLVGPVGGGMIGVGTKAARRANPDFVFMVVRNAVVIPPDISYVQAFVRPSFLSRARNVVRLAFA